MCFNVLTHLYSKNSGTAILHISIWGVFVFFWGGYLFGIFIGGKAKRKFNKRKMAVPEKQKNVVGLHFLVIKKTKKINDTHARKARQCGARRVADVCVCREFSK